MEKFGKASRINPTLGSSDARHATFVFDNRRFANQNAGFVGERAVFGKHCLPGRLSFSCQAPHRFASLAGSSLASLLIDFAPAATHESLLTGYCLNWWKTWKVSGNWSKLSRNCWKEASKGGRVIWKKVMQLLAGTWNQVIQVWWWLTDSQ